MNIVFYTSGISGSGRIVTGIAIYNALKRKHIDCSYTMVTHSQRGYLAETQGIDHIYLPLENEYQLSKKYFHTSLLYHTLSVLKPDVLIVYLQWFTVLELLDELPCTKIFLVRQVDPKYFSFDTPAGKYTFNPAQYSAIVSIEPYTYPFTVLSVNPIVARNHDEILPRKIAREHFNIPDDTPSCLISISGYENESEKYQDYFDSTILKEYHCVTTNTYDSNRIFPIVDYFNAFDLVICGAGYNSFWETKFFQKNAITIPFKRVFENQFYRVNNFSHYTFTTNGADQLVDMIMMM